MASQYPGRAILCPDGSGQIPWMESDGSRNELCGPVSRQLTAWFGPYRCFPTVCGCVKNLFIPLYFIDPPV